jgi:hypothetical protein
MKSKMLDFAFLFFYYVLDIENVSISKDLKKFYLSLLATSLLNSVKTKSLNFLLFKCISLGKPRMSPFFSRR